jgi:predicted adenylyl cyclase CyaB
MSDKEVEQRFIDIDTDKFRKTLKKVGAKLINPKRIMPLMVFFHPRNKKDSYIRIRDEGKQITLTSKTNLKDKYVTEFEVEIDSFEQGIKILNSLGCKTKYYIEKIRETWVLPGCKEIVIDSYPGLKEYIEVDCHNEKSLNAAIKKLGLKIPSDDTDLGITKMYYDQYGIPMNRKADGDLTFKNGKKLFSKYIIKNKSIFNKIIKEQQKYYKK